MGWDCSGPIERVSRESTDDYGDKHRRVCDRDSRRLILFRAFPGTIPFGIIKSTLGVNSLLLWDISVVSVYLSTSREETIFWGERLVNSPLYTEPEHF